MSSIGTMAADLNFGYGNLLGGTGSADMFGYSALTSDQNNSDSTTDNVTSFQSRYTDILNPTTAARAVQPAAAPTASGGGGNIGSYIPNTTVSIDGNGSLVYGYEGLAGGVTASGGGAGGAAPAPKPQGRHIDDTKVNLEGATTVEGYWYPSMSAADVAGNLGTTVTELLASGAKPGQAFTVRHTSHEAIAAAWVDGPAASGGGGTTQTPATTTQAPATSTQTPATGNSAQDQLSSLTALLANLQSQQAAAQGSSTTTTHAGH